jgi:hypothetical protein
MMETREPHALDESIDRALRALFRDEGPPDLRARVEESIARRSTSAAWAWRGGYAAAAALAAVLVVVFASKTSRPETGMERVTMPAPSLAMKRPEVIPAPLEHIDAPPSQPKRLERAARRRRVSTQSQPSVAYIRSWPVPDEPPVDDSSPEGLSEPPAIVVRAVGPPPLVVDALVVEPLQEIEPLAP